MTRRLAVCADDFGMSAGVSEAIARLAQAGRLSAVSCLTTSTEWARRAPLLRGLQGRVDCGLHLNLTEGVPLSPELRRVWPRFPALSRLLLQAGARALPVAAIAAEVDAQLAAWTDAMGRAPDHLDGHQHVHHLPGVRDALLAARHRLPESTGVRSTARVLGPGFGIKRRIIAGTGGQALGRTLQREAVPHNAALLGVYDFAAEDYRALMRSWLASVPAEGALLFCHPADADGAAAHDPIAAARARERDHLQSTAFVDDLAAAGVELGSVWATAPFKATASDKGVGRH